MKSMHPISYFCTHLDVWIIDMTNPTDTIEFHQSSNIGTVQLAVNTNHNYIVIATAHRCTTDADIVGDNIEFPNNKVSHSFFYRDTISPQYQTDFTCQMWRIVAQFRMEVEDAIPSEVTQFCFYVDSSYCKWDIMTNSPVCKIENVVLYASFTRNSDNTASFTATVMAEEDITNVDIRVEALTANNVVYQEREFSDVPVKNGHITTYHGNFFVNFNMGFGFMAEDWGSLGSYSF